MSPQATHSIDQQIAAIALIPGLQLVNRNVHDFSTTGVNLHNPFVYEGMQCKRNRSQPLACMT
jgi:hypothetical protein